MGRRRREEARKSMGIGQRGKELRLRIMTAAGRQAEINLMASPGLSG